MKKRVILATVVAAVLLVAAIAAGINAVFTITLVKADFLTCSEEGEREAEALKKELDSFTGKSTTFFDLAEVERAVSAYPYFRLDEVKKNYPSVIEVRISERREVFAVRTEEGYTTYSENGVILKTASPENSNRAGGENILLEGFAFLGDAMQGDYAEELLSAVSAFSETLVEVRANVLSVTLYRPVTDSRSDFFRIRMREGVVIDILAPSSLPKEKAEAALSRYLALSDEERTFGFIVAADGEDKINVDYSRNSLLG